MVGIKYTIINDVTFNAINTYSLFNVCIFLKCHSVIKLEKNSINTLGIDKSL